MPLTLYYHPLASYCHKVLIALYENGVAFDKRVIDLGNPADRAELQTHWALCKFPVLHDAARQRSVPESSTIIEYVDHHFPAAQALIPADWEQAQTVRLWDRIFDNHVHAPMQEIVLDRIFGSKGDMTAARTLLGQAYALLDQHMASHTWAGGAQFSLADCAAAPALFYATTLQPLPAELVHATRYFNQLMGRPSVARTLQEAKPFFHFYPFAESIPQRFL